MAVRPPDFGQCRKHGTFFWGVLVKETRARLVPSRSAQDEKDLNASKITGEEKGERYNKHDSKLEKDVKGGGNKE